MHEPHNLVATPFLPPWTVLLVYFALEGATAEYIALNLFAVGVAYVEHVNYPKIMHTPSHPPPPPRLHIDSAIVQVTCMAISMFNFL